MLKSDNKFRLGRDDVSLLIRVVVVFSIIAGAMMLINYSESNKDPRKGDAYVNVAGRSMIERCQGTTLFYFETGSVVSQAMSAVPNAIECRG